jgi:hypothetical protein
MEALTIALALDTVDELDLRIGTEVGTLEGFRLFGWLWLLGLFFAGASTSSYW